MIATAAAGATSYVGTPVGYLALAIFVLAYGLVVLEDVLKMKKSKPVVFAAGLIWIVVAAGSSLGKEVNGKVMHHLAEFAALFMFLTVAMTYINAIAHQRVFLALNAWLVGKGFSLRTIFWATGVLAFWISPIADNMTTALVMGAVVITVGGSNVRFIATSCTSVVIAANAGGAFSPFGDITTLMVWEAEKVSTFTFLQLMLPCVVNWLVPAFLMSLTIPKEKPEPLKHQVVMTKDWWIVVLLFLATIATAVFFHMKLHLPPFLGMTTGLGYLLVFGYFQQTKYAGVKEEESDEATDVFKHIEDVEWDTLLFFFGVILCVGGLAELGFLAAASTGVYDQLGAFWANVLIGLLSAVIDNVPVMFAVLGMDPTMSVSQWLLVTLTAGVGGSLLAVGSAAGVALLGAAHGKYTFVKHLRWTPAIALGYGLSICVHALLQQHVFA
ncbi:MAG: sodium:proton antiporter NhaD [Planctomycetes bacterium]|nr:sodium:proton antiporter NhaD [Planctomycetota bacterium]